MMAAKTIDITLPRGYTQEHAAHAFTTGPLDNLQFLCSRMQLVCIRASSEQASVTQLVESMLVVRSSFGRFGHARLELHGDSDSQTSWCKLTCQRQPPETTCTNRAIEVNDLRIPSGMEGRRPPTLTPAEAMLLTECPFMWIGLSRLALFHLDRGQSMQWVRDRFHYTSDEGLHSFMFGDSEVKSWKVPLRTYKGLALRSCNSD